MSYLIAIVVFGLLIFVHELGHFIVAKLSGIHVLQFTIGFGPALVKKEYRGTVYALRLLPLGGAVMMQGEDAGEEELLVGEKGTTDSENASSEGSFAEASILKRFLVCIAGAGMNFISGVLIVFLLLLPVKSHTTPQLAGFLGGFPYAAEDNADGLGFQVGDTIVRVNDFHIYTMSDFNLAMAYDADQHYDITLRRDGQTVRLKDFEMQQTVLDEESGSYLYGFQLQVQSMNLFEKLAYAGKTAMTYLQSAVMGLKMLVTGQVGTADMMGTVGIAGEMGALAKTSLSSMWNFVAYISINLAFVNLLPIPALDGGKVLFLLIELIRGKKLDPKYEGVASMIGMVLLIGVFIFVTYQDIARLIGG